MRVAALYDVHGNLPALDAVLAEVDRDGVDLVVSGGDLVSGPMPAEVFDRLALATLRETGAPVSPERAGRLLEPPDPDEVSAFFESQRTG